MSGSFLWRSGSSLAIRRAPIKRADKFAHPWQEAEGNDCDGMDRRPSAALDVMPA
jgi:hypothetical protein